MENMNFWFIQLIGALAWVILVISYYRENTDKILVFHIIATILYCLHYYLLGAYMGQFICTFEIIRDFSYYKTDADKYIFVGSIPIYILLGIFTYTMPIDLLPIFSSFVDGYTLTKKKKIVVIGAIISYGLWIIYNIKVRSYAGVLTDGILAVSNLSILLFDKGLFKGKDIRKV